MKAIKIAFLFTMLCMITPAVVAQDATEVITVNSQVELKEVAVDELFDEMSEIKDVNDLKITPFMLGMAKMFAPKEDQVFLNKVKSMRIIMFSDCSAANKKRFEQYISSIRIKGFETEEPTDEERKESEVENIKAFIKRKGETINEIVVADFNEKEPVLMYIKGKFSISELEELASGKNPIMEDAKND